MFSRILALALVMAALGPGARTAHAQAAAVTYWTPGWPVGFAGNLATGESANTYGNFPSFDGRDARGFSVTRYNFSNGWFVGGEAGTGLNMTGFNRDGALGNTSFYTQGVQFGYNFQNTPLTVYAGFDTLNYKTNLGSPFAPFDSRSGTVPGYSAQVGVEIRPTSNLSLSLGVGYTQFDGGDINSLTIPGAAPFGGGIRR